MDADEIYDAAGVFVGAVLIILLIVFISICKRRHSPVSEHDEGPAARSLDEVGLDEATIRSYPKVSYSEAKKQMVTGNRDINGSVSAPSSCSICLADYEDNDILTSVPNCRHFFHQICVDKWLQLHPTCPICRNSPLDPPAILISSVASVATEV